MHKSLRKLLPGRRPPAEEPVRTEESNTPSPTSLSHSDDGKTRTDHKRTSHDVYPVRFFEALNYARTKERVHNLCKICEPVFPDVLGHPLYDPDQRKKVRHELDNRDWPWTAGRIQAYGDEQGFTDQTQSLRQICENALDGCDGCGLVLYGIANADKQDAFGYAEDQCFLPEDRFKAHLWQLLPTESRVLEITHYSKFQPAYDFRLDLSLAAEIGSPTTKYVSGRVDFGGTESSGTLGLMKKWLDKCVTSGTHEKCSSSDTPLPSRVLDVRRGLCLHETKHTFGKYATLSYCWGGEQPGKLLTTNRTTYLAGIVEADQPKTIRDAVKVTRALGLSFLWIDSYCILQDSREDKAAEIGSMAQIFQNSHITLAAACASSVEEGFLKPTSNLVVMPLHVKLPDRAQGEIWLKGTYFRTSHSRDPINRRAWTLQEQALSKRILYFPSKNRDVEFQCESYGFHNMTAMTSLGGGVYLGVGAGMNQTLSLPGRIYADESKGLLLWSNVVGVYTTRALTEMSDKVVALTGVASEFAALLGPTYLAGLWERHLISQLLWFTRESMPKMESIRRPGFYTGPSWSWTSLAGPISLHTSLPPSDDDRRKYDWMYSLRLRIVGHRLELINQGSVFGAVKFAELVVHGWLMYALITQSDPPFSWPKSDRYTALRLEPLEVWEHDRVSYEEAMGSASLDIKSEYPLKVDVYCLIVNFVDYSSWEIFWRIKHQERHSDTIYVQGGLLLTKDSDSEPHQNRYRRIGVFHIDPNYEHRFIDAAHKQTINLV